MFTASIEPVSKNAGTYKSDARALRVSIDTPVEFPTPIDIPGPKWAITQFWKMKLRNINKRVPLQLNSPRSLLFSFLVPQRLHIDDSLGRMKDKGKNGMIRSLLIVSLAKKWPRLRAKWWAARNTGAIWIKKKIFTRITKWSTTGNMRELIRKHFDAPWHISCNIKYIHPLSELWQSVNPETFRQ